MAYWVASQPYFLIGWYRVNPPSIFVGTRLNRGLGSPGSLFKLSSRDCNFLF
jgi:hypothetical protein